MFFFQDKVPKTRSNDSKFKSLSKIVSFIEKKKRFKVPQNPPEFPTFAGFFSQEGSPSTRILDNEPLLYDG